MTNRLSTQEYYDLIKKLIEQQYTDDSEPESTTSYSDGWIPASPEIKQKMKLLADEGTVDLTNVKSNKIKELIIQSKNKSVKSGIKIGDFLIKITRSECYNPDMSDLIVDICVYEEQHKTKSGAPAKLLFKIDTIKDSRFTQCSWNSYFNQFKSAKNVPINILVEIVRWLRAVKKLTAFL
jgi:hypothetical protein